MDAHDTMLAARAAYDRQHWQLSFEDSAPEAVDGSPTKPSRLVLSPGAGSSLVSPGPSTDPASTDGSSLPPDGAVTFPESEERDAGFSNPTATAAEPVRVGAAVAGGEFT